jgi:hypothetical protein
VAAIHVRTAVAAIQRRQGRKQCSTALLVRPSTYFGMSKNLQNILQVRNTRALDTSMTPIHRPAPPNSATLTFTLTLTRTLSLPLQEQAEKRLPCENPTRLRGSTLRGEKILQFAGV